MKPTVWKWMFGLSLALLILLAIFTVGFWAFGNATAAMTAATMGSAESIAGLTFGEFMWDFTCSPMFYVFSSDLVLLAISVIMLIITRHTNKECNK